MDQNITIKTEPIRVQEDDTDFTVDGGSSMDADVKPEVDIKNHEDYCLSVHNSSVGCERDVSGSCFPLGCVHSEINIKAEPVWLQEDDEVDVNEDAVEEEENGSDFGNHFVEEAISRHQAPNEGLIFKAPATQQIKKRKQMRIDKVQKYVRDVHVLTVCKKLPEDFCALYGELTAARLRSFDVKRREIVMNNIDNLVLHAIMNQSDMQSVPSHPIPLLPIPLYPQQHHRHSIISQPPPENSSST